MSLRLPAYAKVNLTLEVLSKRDDGYHEIASVLQTISLADTLDFEVGGELELRCNVPDLESADNLVLKAARLLQNQSGHQQGATITLVKRIPVASGLGSGATDAAATLVGLNQLWALGLSAPALGDLAARLGSDVAFFLCGGTALARGRGEKVTPLPAVARRYMVLLSPQLEPVPNKTARLYSQLRESHFSRGQHTERLVDRLEGGGDFRTGMLHNVFEQVAFGFFPGLSDYRGQLLEAGVRTVHLAGSGPCLFAPVGDEVEGKGVLNRLAGRGLEAFLVHTVEAPLPAPHRDVQC